MRPIRLIVLLALFACALVAEAQNVVGIWHGKFVIDASAVKLPTDVEKRKAFQARLDMLNGMIAKAKVTLTLNTNKTFTLLAENVPGTVPVDKSVGTYTKTAKDVVLLTKTENGKPPTGSSAKPQHVEIAGGGKKLVMQIQNASSVKVTLVFTR